MALEMKVFKEITQFQPKVMMGMTWRQMLWAGIGAVVVFGVYVPLMLLGYSQIGTYIASLAMVPCAALGWVRPHGMPFEQYAGFVWRYHTNPQVRTYSVTEKNEVKNVWSPKAARRIEVR